MKDKPCEIVQDLMPLVIDSAASEGSRQWVEAHVAECADCARAMEGMRGVVQADQVGAKDADFIRFCLKMRRTLSWRRLAILALSFALAIGLIVGGVSFARYKMYVDGAPFKPEDYSISVDMSDHMLLEVTLDGAHGLTGHRGRFQTDTGILTITPLRSAWPQIFERAENRDGRMAFMWVRLAHGELVYDEPYFYEHDRSRDEAQPPQAQRIKEIRLGTEEEYVVIYRAGDLLPVTIQ